MKTTTHYQQGFSLVEVMAGLLVGLITTVVIYQVLAVSEGYKRTTAGGGEAQQNGAIALYLLERDLRQAGAGLDFGVRGTPGRASPIGSNVNASESGRTINFILAPVVITPGATANDSDTVTVLYGNANRNGDIKAVAPPGMSSANVDVPLLNTYGFLQGDLFIVAGVGVTGVLAQVTNINGSSLEHANITINNTNYNQNAFPLAYSQTATVMNLGSFMPQSEPALNRYTVTDNQVTLTRLLVTNDAVPVADNAVILKAQYGIDSTNSGRVDTYANALPSGVPFTQIRSIRIGIVSRINVYEKQVVTTSLSMWTGGPTVTFGGDDSHYRYRVYSTTVALRNAIW